ncbi:hypothetical protein [Caulobacter sp. BP25]|uniref:hypothetical protein n=1 Tax=Caulobacter sp. BP25 TaxID=2048900 RepID=UPI000C129C63|nr:hypothetical protein [Caulobacter sp. BP25]PHY22396.1 hypothetical protein CSW59_02975 [Caulobacter sp. BP25]
MSENSPARLPNVLLDAVTFGFRFDLTPFSSDAMDAFRGNLGHLLTKGTDRHRLVLEVPIGRLGELGFAKVELVPALSTPGRFGSMSNVSFNGMRLLRRHLHGQGFTNLSLDNSDNFIGPIVRPVEQLLHAQLDLMALALATVARALDEAVPAGCDTGAVETWLKSAEACLDLEVQDAKEAVRRLQRTGLPGRTRYCVDWYRASATDSAGAITVRYWRQQHGPCFKVYAKDHQLLRVEIDCANRAAFRALKCTQKDGHVDGTTARKLLLEFAELAEPLLNDLRTHVLEAADATASVDELLLALSPLLDLRRGIGAPTGRIIKVDTASAASEAIESLFTSGAVEATGWRHGHALRRILDELSNPSGPLVHSSRRAIFCLRPSYARAAESVAEMT